MSESAQLKFVRSYVNAMVARDLASCQDKLAEDFKHVNLPTTLGVSNDNKASWGMRLDAFWKVTPELKVSARFYAMGVLLAALLKRLFAIRWKSERSTTAQGRYGLRCVRFLLCCQARCWVAFKQAKSNGTLVSGDSYVSESIVMLKIKDVGDGKFLISEMKEFHDAIALNKLKDNMTKIVGQTPPRS
jgi:hypothetical protein